MYFYLTRTVLEFGDYVVVNAWHSFACCYGYWDVVCGVELVEV